MSLFEAPTTVEYTEEELEFVRRPINGDGGDQRLLRKLGLGPSFIDHRHEVEDQDLQKVYHYAYGFATGGGYQDRFRAIVKAAIRSGWRVPEKAGA